MQVYQLRGSANPELELLVGDLTYTTQAPAITSGKGFTITDDGTGLFSVISDFPWSDAWPVAIRKCATAVGGTVQLVSKDAANRKLSFRILNDADAAEDPADNDGVIFQIWYQRSGLPA
jgi:hypothetical protein